MSLDIGAKIKQLRIGRGMTQEQVGTELGLSAQAVSKWEAGTTMPDITLLPQLSVLFGVSIDELFSMTDESRMERIENMIEDERFLSDTAFADAERFLKEKIQDRQTKPAATLLLAQLYGKRANEYRELAAPLARQALWLNPNEKAAHNAIMLSEGVPCADWNVRNHWKLIQFYKDFLQQHPDNPRTYLWIMDLLLLDGRTEEARSYLTAMDRLEHSHRTDLYAGYIAKTEGDLPRALQCWQHMAEEFPDDWMVYFGLADCMAELCRYEESIAYNKKALDMQPHPKYTDAPEAMAQIAEIRGDYAEAIAMREKCIEICRDDWGLTEGEIVDFHRREIARLRELL